MNNLDFKKIKERLPSSLNILDKDEHFNSAVLIPFIKVKKEYHLLFEKRDANIRQGGEVSFPGGEFDKDKDKNYLDTAIRETVEELGIQKDKINVIGQFGILIVPGMIINSFIGEIRVENLNEINFDKTEVEKVFTVPVSFFKENKPEIYHVRLEAHPYYYDSSGNKIELLPVEKLKLPEMYSKPWGKIKRKVYVYNYDGEVIWGITAALVKKVIEIL